MEETLAQLGSRMRLHESPSRISLSYWQSNTKGKQARQFRLMFLSRHVDAKHEKGAGYELTLTGFRRGD